MTLNEYYLFPEGTNASLSFQTNWFCEHPNYPCPSDMKYAFYGYRGSYVPPLDTSNVTEMSYMFEYAYGVTELDLTGWNVGNVTEMSYMFNYFKTLTSINLSGWDTSKVKKMKYMFAECENITELDLSGWDVSNVTDMSYMFNNLRNATSINLSGWDTSKVTTMNIMFGGCSKLTAISSIDCSGLSTKNYYPLYSTSENTTLTDVGGFLNMKMTWDNNYGLTKFPNLTYESCINILNGLYDFTGNGETPTSNQGKLKVHSNFLTLVGDEISIGVNKGWTITA